MHAGSDFGEWWKAKGDATWCRKHPGEWKDGSWLQCSDSGKRFHDLSGLAVGNSELFDTSSSSFNAIRLNIGALFSVGGSIGFSSILGS
jgi:hypothetical protein